MADHCGIGPNPDKTQLIAANAGPPPPEMSWAGLSGGVTSLAAGAAVELVLFESRHTKVDRQSHETRSALRRVIAAAIV